MGLNQLEALDFHTLLFISAFVHILQLEFEKKTNQVPKFIPIVYATPMKILYFGIYIFKGYFVWYV